MMKDELRKMLCNTTDEELLEFKKEYEEKMKRKEKSFFHCRIPDWTGEGGMIEFWINEDNTLECENGMTDEAIRTGIEMFYREYAI